MRIIEDTKLDFSDVLLQPKRSKLSSRSEVDITRNFTFPHSETTWEGFPLVVANMASVGTLEMFRAMRARKGLVALHKHYTLSDYINFFAANPHVESADLIITIGMKHYTKDVLLIDELESRLTSNPKFICIDVANGYMEDFHKYVSLIRKDFPDKIIIAGNVVTGEMTEQLILAGADIVKVGIGSGAQCLTRRVTGVGMPQLSAVIECADAAHGLGGHIMSDGGVVYSGDVVKAFGAGADFVMAGSIFGGTDESSGEVVEVEGKKYLKLYGMSSEYANKKYFGGMSSYRASEGRQTLVEHKGPADILLQDIEGGIRSAMTYIGARTIKDIPKCTTFIRVNNQLNNSHANNQTFK